VIEAPVSRVEADGATKGMGTFRFVLLPAVGDRLTFGTWNGVEFFRVVRIEHGPVAIPTPPTARPDPTVTLFVAWDGAQDLSDA
jgi:hypothetical protein